MSLRSLRMSRYSNISTSDSVLKMRQMIQKRTGRKERSEGKTIDQVYTNTWISVFGKSGEY
jgi:hypothetical protein